MVQSSKGTKEHIGKLSPIPVPQSPNSPPQMHSELSLYCDYFNRNFIYIQAYIPVAPLKITHQVKCTGHYGF